MPISLSFAALLLIVFMVMSAFGLWAVFSHRVSDSLFDRIILSSLSLSSLSGMVTTFQDGILPLSAITTVLLLLSGIFVKQMFMAYVGNKCLSRMTLFLKVERAKINAQKIK